MNQVSFTGQMEPPGQSGWKGIFRSTLITTLLSALNLILTFVVQVVLAAYFGAGQEMDAYLAAAALPTLINTVLLGAFNFVLVPQLTTLKANQDEAGSWAVVNGFITLSLLILSGVSFLVIVIALPLATWIAPGFSPQTTALTATLLRILFPGTVFYSLVSILSSIYYTRRRFVMPMLAPALGNGVILLAVFLFSEQLGIVSVAVGALAETIFQALLLLPILWQSGQFRFAINWHDPRLQRTFQLMLPLILGSLLYKATGVVERFLGSSLSAGSISYLGYAFKLATALVTITTQGIATVWLPLLSSHAAVQDRVQMRHAVSLGLRILSLILAPIMVWVVLLGEPVVQLLFQRGAFDQTATWGTSLAWIGYLGWVYAGAWGAILTNAFYALQETKTVVRIGLRGMILHLFLSVLLSRPLEFFGLSLALSGMAVFNAIVFLWLLRRRLGGIEAGAILITVGKTLVAASMMALSLLLSRDWLAQQLAFVASRQITLIFYLAGTGSLSLLIYLGVAFALRCAELDHLLRLLGQTIVNLRMAGRSVL